MNSKINPNYDLEEDLRPKVTSNLIGMAADIINVEKKLNSLIDTNENDDPLASIKTAVNLIGIAHNIRGTESSSDQASNLTQIACEIRENDPKRSIPFDLTGD